MSTAEKFRLNLGCGKFPLEGYVNVDSHEPADIEGNVWACQFEQVDEVRMDHFLEHFGWRETVPLLERVRSWMVKGGRLDLEVPDTSAILDFWRDNPDWLRYVYGSQQHEGEFHKNGFTQESLEKALADAGFEQISVTWIRSEHPSRRGMACLKAVAFA